MWKSSLRALSVPATTNAAHDEANHRESKNRVSAKTTSAVLGRFVYWLVWIATQQQAINGKTLFCTRWHWLMIPNRDNLVSLSFQEEDHFKTRYIVLLRLFYT